MLPVPFHPPHHCPHCGYIVGGLTHRRCPECGEDFTLSEAQMAAAGGAWPYDRSDLAVLRGARLRLDLGLIFLAAGFGVPCAVNAWIAGGFSHRVLTHMMLFVGPLSLLAWFVLHAVDADWPTVILVWGLLALAVGALFTLLMI